MEESNISEYNLNSELELQTLKTSIISNNIYILLENKSSNKKRYSSKVSLPQIKKGSNAFSSCKNIKDALTILNNTIESGKIFLSQDGKGESISLTFNISLANGDFPPYVINLMLEKAQNGNIEVLPIQFDYQGNKEVEQKYAEITKNTTEFEKPIIQSKFSEPIVQLEYVEPILQVHYPDGTTKSKALPPRIQSINGKTSNVGEVSQEQLKLIQEQLNQNALKSSSFIANDGNNLTSRKLESRYSTKSVPIRSVETNIQNMQPYYNQNIIKLSNEINNNNLVSNYTINNFTSRNLSNNNFNRTYEIAPNFINNSQNLNQTSPNPIHSFRKLPPKILPLTRSYMRNKSPALESRYNTTTYQPLYNIRNQKNNLLNSYNINIDNSQYSRNTSYQVNKHQKMPFSDNSLIQRVPTQTTPLKSNLPNKIIKSQYISQSVTKPNPTIQESSYQSFQANSQIKNYPYQNQTINQIYSNNQNYQQPPMEEETKVLKPIYQTLPTSEAFRPPSRVIKPPVVAKDPVFPSVLPTQTLPTIVKYKNPPFQDINNYNTTTTTQYANNTQYVNNINSQLVNNTTQNVNNTPKYENNINKVSKKDIENNNAKQIVEQPSITEEDEIIDNKNDDDTDNNEEQEEENAEVEQLFKTEEGHIIFRNGILQGIIRKYSEIDFVVTRIQDSLCKGAKFTLLYRASTDKDKAQIFHEKCDNHQMTLVIIQTTKGVRFGGFTTKTWEGKCVKKLDNNCFIFSIDNLKIYDIVKGQPAIGCYPKYGPVFFGCQIRIYDDFFTKGGSTCLKGLNFKTQKDFELNKGEQSYIVKDIEVYDIEAIDI